MQGLLSSRETLGTGSDTFGLNVVLVLNHRKKPNSTLFSFYKKISYVLLDFLKTHDFLDFLFFFAANFLVSAAASAAGRSTLPGKNGKMTYEVIMTSHGWILMKNSRFLFSNDKRHQSK